MRGVFAPLLALGDEVEQLHQKMAACTQPEVLRQLIQKYEQISFVEAVYKVAEIIGVPMDHPLEIAGPPVDPHAAALYKVCQDTIEYTHYELQTPDGEQVKHYLYQRGIDDAMIECFALGFNPPNDAL